MTPLKVLYHHTGWAGYYIALGWERAFNALGHRCTLFGDWNSAEDFVELLNSVRPDVVWTSESQLGLLDLDEVKKAQQSGMFLLVRVSPYPGSGRYPELDLDPDGESHRLLIREYANAVESFYSSEFVRTEFQWYRSVGLPVLNLPLACDSEIYKSVREYPTSELGVVYCGGYLPRKRRMFEEFLFPAYREYGGVISGYSWPDEIKTESISQARESEFYQRATVCPCIMEDSIRTTPHDPNEKPFKILGSGGFCIATPNESYWEYFEPDELFVVADGESFMSYVDLFTRNPSLRNDWVSRGRQRVLRCHTYRHRVEQFVKEIESLR